VAEVVAEAARCWTARGDEAAEVDAPASWRAVTPLDAKREAATLRLDCRKAAAELGWQARLDLAAAVGLTVEWYRAFHAGAGAFELRALTRRQIADHAAAAAAFTPTLRRAS
jgi:CDP-glucose 4,6-dehydratase